MSKRVLVLVEGQTEERFVKDILAPHFLERGVFLSPTLLVTKRVKDGPNFKGGVTSFAKFERDVWRLLNGAGNAWVTTLIDYYGLPDDFPGMRTRPDTLPAERVRHIEDALRQHFGNRTNFVPFFALHEFEAWLFSAPDVLARVMTQPDKESELAAIRSSVNTPEDINEHPAHAPSKRICSIFPSYRKKLHGPAAANRMGLSRIRAECPHFAVWINELERYAI